MRRIRTFEPTRRPAFAALAVAAVAAVPLGGSSAALAVPAQFAGYDCGIETTNDITGIVHQDPQVQIGTTQAGPIAVSNALSITITCWVQINTGDTPNPSQAAASESQTTPGPVGVLDQQISFAVMPTDNVYLCTRFTWSNAVQSGSYTKPTCDLAITAGEPMTAAAAAYEDQDFISGTTD